MPTFYTADGTYHTRRRCRLLHRTSDRITRTDAPDGDPCDRCVEGDGPTAAERDIAGLLDMGICPWCDGEDGYEGDHVGQHASSAHPEAWTAYSEA